MRIAVTAGHNVYISKYFDPGAVNPPLTEANIVKDTISILVTMLERQGHTVLDATPYNEKFINSKASHVERCERVDKFNADVYLDIHLNAGGGTGVEVWVHNMNSKSVPYAIQICENISKDMGLANRGVKNKSTFWSVSLTSKPAMIVEGAFVDNKLDMEKLTPLKYATAIARAFGEIKENNPIISNKSLYKVQVGAYSVKSNAQKLLKDLEAKGFKGYIKEEHLEVQVVKKKNVTYKSSNGSTVIEVDPLDLYIDVVKSPGTNIKGDFINGSFYDMKSMKSISTLVSNGKILSEHLPHDNVKRGTFVIYKNGNVAVEMIDFISKHPNLLNIKFAIGGFNVLPIGKTIREQLKSEWFEFNTVGYKTWRSMIGYSKKINKVLIVIAPNMNAEEGSLLMKKIGCDISIGLDSGGSTCGRFNGNLIKDTTRVIHNIIRW